LVVTHLGIIVASIVVGAMLAVGAAFGVSSVIGGSQSPPNQTLYNYGTP
jgi:uncharacterized membrane protein